MKELLIVAAWIAAWGSSLAAAALVIWLCCKPSKETIRLRKEAEANIARIRSEMLVLEKQGWWSDPVRQAEYLKLISEYCRETRALCRAHRY